MVILVQDMACNNPLFAYDYAYTSCIKSKLDFCLGDNKGADQLRSYCEADKHLCFSLHE